MNRSCHVEDRQLVAFAGGEPVDIDEHVGTCDECQDFLAELWSGGLDHDLSEPVVKAIRLELWVMEIARAAFDIGELMGRAAGTFLVPPNGDAGRE